MKRRAGRSWETTVKTECEMDGINRYRVVTSMVRGFFEGYFSGLAEGRGLQTDSQLLRQLAAEHYGAVAGPFFHVMFPLLAALSFESYEAVREDMKRRHFSDETPVRLLLRYACRSRGLYEAMTEEYRRQFTALLSGHVQRQEEHMEGRAEAADLEDVATGQAIRAVVRALMHGYVMGIKAAGQGGQSLRQATVLRLMVSGMSTLLHDRPFEVWADAESLGLDGVYRRVCRDARNYETLIGEMNQAYQDLAFAEGVRAADEAAE